MFGKGPIFLIALVAAVFLPYWISEHRGTESAASFWDSLWQSDDTPDEGSSPFTSSWPVASTSPAAPFHVPYPQSPSAAPLSNWNPLQQAGGPNATGPLTAGPRAQSLPELFRFDATSAWIMNRWGRVSTGLIEEDLEGLRVTVVSGTGPYDIAGSLTYYFDRQYQVQRIHFSGYSPDPAQLVEFMMRQYGLAAEPLLGAGLFLRRDADKIINAMRIQHAPVVRSDSPNRRYAVALELNRPDRPQGLSASFAQMLEKDRRARRWAPDVAEEQE